MSESGKGKSIAGAGESGGGAIGRDAGSGGDDDEDRHETKGKCGVVLSLGKTRYGLRRRRKKRLSLSMPPPPSPSTSSSNTADGVSHRCGGGAVVGGFGGCFRRPRTSGSPPSDSPTSDPNDPEFSYESLRALIERNDFYSKECNPHLNETPKSME